MNATMADLRKAFEAAGFSDVRTVISSGNVVFTTRATRNASIERRAEKAMQAELGRTFLTIVRPIEALEDLLESDPFAAFNLPAGTKRIVTFLHQPTEAVVRLPQTLGDARIHAMKDTEIFSSYVPAGNNPEFMLLIERNYGKELTTRTWETVGRVVKAARS